MNGDGFSATATTTIVHYHEVNYKYKLAVNFFYQTDFSPLREPRHGEWVKLYPDGMLYFRRCYMWDGPSGPTWDTSNSIRASLVHDGLYQLIREGVLPPTCRKEADRIFYQILTEDGMRGWRRLFWWRAVRRFAAYAIRPRRNHVKVAPLDPRKRGR